MRSVFKKIQLFTFTFLLLYEVSYACGGCRDAYLGSSKSQESISRFLEQEAEITNSINALNNILESKILKAEQEIRQNYENLLNLNKEYTLSKQNFNFLLKKQKEIHSIINNIKAN